jgi:3-mercaptopyruvate sulfurtransferase SseA
MTTHPATVPVPPAALRARRPLLAAPAALACVAAVLALVGTPAAEAAPAQRLEVAQAQAAVAHGTTVWDLRTQGAVLPGAVRLPAAALRAWLLQGELPALAAAVSAHGINLAGTVLLVADDDAQAEALAHRLAPLSRGHIAWLAGGAAAWQAAGLPLVTDPSRRLPVPQRLVAIDPAPASPPAAAALRTTADFTLAATPAAATARVAGSGAGL